jgi:hypothetical protein
MGHRACDSNWSYIIPNAKCDVFQPFSCSQSVGQPRLGKYASDAERFYLLPSSVFSVHLKVGTLLKHWWVDKLSASLTGRGVTNHSTEYIQPNLPKLKRLIKLYERNIPRVRIRRQHEQVFVRIARTPSDILL